jgi:UDP-glucose:(heptosyl)LPS alpha-1,3-glucosyltransferase
LRLAVISPFLDRHHGTERCIVEQLERFAAYPEVEIHLYSQRVEDLTGVIRFSRGSSSGRILWHKVSAVRGPHLVGYVWWFLANHILRWWDTRIGGLSFDLVYTPGINVLDADVISVHIVFHEFLFQVRTHLNFRDSPIVNWPRLFHRRLYYRIIMALERLVYRRRATSLTAISHLVSTQLESYFHRNDAVMIRYGVDTTRFSPSLRLARRASTRERFRISAVHFTLLLIGNDWKKKGLEVLLNALAECRELPLILLVVGTDDQSPYNAFIRTSGVSDRVHFLNPCSDVLQFYAAADAYVGPSLEDAYALPILEAMACGLPVIASSRAGISEIISDRKDGLILRDPQDPGQLAQLLRELYSDPGLCRSIGEQGCLTAERQTWDHNAAKTWEVLKSAAARKQSSVIHAQES